jgi:hypothetical protein
MGIGNSVGVYHCINYQLIQVLKKQNEVQVDVRNNEKQYLNG